jgi:hypothetical protein
MRMATAIILVSACVFEAAAAMEPTVPAINGGKNPSSDQITVFGLALGRDKLIDVANKAVMRERKDCGLSNLSGSVCDYPYEKQSTLSLYNLSDSSKNIYIFDSNNALFRDLHLFSTKFYINGENLVGTFSNDVLISLELESEYNNRIPTDLNIPNLMVALNKKHQRQKDQVFPSRIFEGFLIKHTLYHWKTFDGKTGIFIDREDSILVNKAACLDKSRRALDISLTLYNAMRNRCDGNSVFYSLHYRAVPLFGEVYKKAQQLLANKNAEENAASKRRLNKF